MGYFKQKFRSVKKLPTWIYWLPARFMQLYVRLFFRVRIVDPNDHIGQARGAVSVTWHNRLMFFAVLFPARARKRTVAVVSASRDGANAYRAGIKAIREGYNVSFTPDGPRGPRYVMKSGPIALASVTGTGIIPIAVNASRCWSVKSWDRFQIPKPFSTLTLVLGDLIPIPENLDEAGIEFYRKKVEDILNEISVDPPENR